MLKLVNALPATVNLKLDGISLPDDSCVVGFDGNPSDMKVKTFDAMRREKLINVKNSVLQLPPYSVIAISFNSNMVTK